MTTPMPNVLLVMTDQQRWDTLGCAGGPVESPNLDWIAAQGTMFTRAYSATPSCVPARASLMTGMDPWNTGILGMGAGQPGCGNLSNTLPGILGSAGWHTQGVGKMHFTPQRSLQGFHHTVLDESGRELDKNFRSDYSTWFARNAPAEVDRFGHGIDWNSWVSRPFHLPEYLHPTAWTVNEAIRFLQRRDPTRPFFLKVSFARPHSPYDAPPYYFDLYDRREDLPRAAVGEWAAAGDVPGEAADPNAWRSRRSEREIHRARAGYYGNINHIDHQIGRLTKYLRQEGLDADTLVVFTSDHGDMLGDHHLWRKTYGYEGSAHVPLIVRLPAAMRDGARRQSEAPVCLQDIMPTILDACGVPAPATVDGHSLLPLIRGTAGRVREFVHGEHSMCYHPSQEMQYLTDGRWKYLWFPRTGSEQLFDLASDPYECHCLAADARHAATLAQWRERLVRILAARDAGLTEGDALVRQAGRPPLVSPAARNRPYA